MLKKTNDNFMPLGLLSLAASLLKNHIKAEIYKPSIRLFSKESFTAAAEDIIKHKPEIIGFSTWCISYPAVLLIAREIKNQAPEIPIIFGGPHASTVAAETLSTFGYVDFILAGEADFSLPEFILEHQKPYPDFFKIPGLWYKNEDGEIKHSPIRMLLKNPDELPVPDYHLIAKTKWLKLDVGRGCPFQCTYCSTSLFFSKKYRIKTAERIFSEMAEAWQKRKITTFSFAHDMLTLNKTFVFELCEKLINFRKSEGVRFKWNCSARIDCVNKEMLAKMKLAGCSDVFFGIETGSERMQQIIKKKLNISKIYEIADFCRITGIRMHASFIIGFPEETKIDLNLNLKCILKLATMGALVQVSELSLLPGTPLFAEHQKNLKFDGKFSNFSRNFCSPDEIKLIKKYPGIFSSFYYLPVTIMTRNEILFLRLFINRLKDFRNTLFLFDELLEKDFAKIDWVSLVKKEIKNLNLKTGDPGAISMYVIKLINNYIDKSEESVKHKYLKDVFSYDSYSALLCSLYSAFDLKHLSTRNPNLNMNCEIVPTPIWKILTLNYKPDKILPFENGWKKNPSRIKKGNYSFLLLAESGTKCNRIRIDKTDNYLLNALSNCSVDEYIKKIESKDYKKEVFNWLRKMKKLGVIEIRPLKNIVKQQPRFAESV